MMVFKAETCYILHFKSLPSVAVVDCSCSFLHLSYFCAACVKEVFSNKQMHKHKLLYSFY
jgi:hypothetical protein